MLAHNLVQQIHMAFKRGWADSLKSKVNKVVDSVNVTNITTCLPKDKFLLETLYFVASWLYFAACKHMSRCCKGSNLQQFLSKLEGPCTEELQDLPIAKVKRTEVHAGKLNFASMSLFHFVAAIEKVTEEVWLPRSLILYGPGIVDKLKEILCKSNKIMNMMRDCLDEGDQVDTVCFLDGCSYLIHTYM
jgi:hypothetical protein